MDPNNQPGQVPPIAPVPPHEPLKPAEYDFITNPPKVRKKSFFSPAKGDTKGILKIVGVAFSVFIVFLFIGSLIFSGDSDRDVLLEVARKQSEVIAVAKLGAEDGGTIQAQSLGIAVQLSVMTDQNQIIAHLTKKGKVKDKDYADQPSSKVVSALETAQRNGRFDEVFSNSIKQELTEYQQELRTANAAVSSQSAKDFLATDYENASLLLAIPSIN